MKSTKVRTAPEETPETFAEYLRRLAADCEESGNAAHAEDHRASARAIERLSEALVAVALTSTDDPEAIAKAKAALAGVASYDAAVAP